MSPKPFVTSQYDDPDTELAWCQDCQHHYWTGLGHDCDQKPRVNYGGWPLALLVSLLVWGLIALGVILAFTPRAHAQQVRIPTALPAPPALLRARQACPNTASIVQCRSALVRAYSSVEWQRHARWHAQATTIKQITLDAITWAAQRYGVPASQMIGIGTCESHLYPFATNGQYKGWGQLSTRHRSDPIFRVVPWQDAYAEASHIARYIKAHGEGEWQCVSTGDLRW